MSLSSTSSTCSSWPHGPTSFIAKSEEGAPAAISTFSASSSSTSHPALMVEQPSRDINLFGRTSVNTKVTSSILSFLSTDDAKRYLQLNRPCLKSKNKLLTIQLKAKSHPLHSVGFSISEFYKLRDFSEGTKEERWERVLTQCSTLTTLRPSAANSSTFSKKDLLENPLDLVQALNKNCSELTHVSFPEHWVNHLPAMIELIKNSPKLTSIDLSGFPLTDEMCHDIAKAISEGGLKITDLNLENCNYSIALKDRKLTRSGLGDLVYASPHLTSLNLSKCLLSEHRGRLPVFRYVIYPSLKNLNCSLYKLEADESDHIAVYCPSLTTLNIEGADFGFRNFRHISLQCKQLTTIICNQCYRFTDKCLKTLAECCPRLNRIDFSGCEDITDIDLTNVIQGPHHLNYIDCSKCKNISDECVNKLKRDYPHITFIR